MRILLFGGSGTLGQELMKINPEIIRPTRDYLDINDSWNVKKYIHEVRPDIVINSAAETSSIKVDADPIKAIKTNIIATANIATKCHELGIRLIYISTDYIYKSDRGNYKEEDEILPVNLYAWTKLGGECSVKAVKNHLIIRTSFGKSKFEHPSAFSDKWTSKDYVDVIAPMIYEAAISGVTGILNIGTERKTIYDYAKRRNPEIHPIEILKNTNFTTAKDSSLNLEKYKAIFDKESKRIKLSHE